MDPRLARDGLTLADLREQLDHNLRVRDMVSEVNQTVARLQRAKRRLQAASGAAADTLQRLTALESKLVTAPIRYSQPGLQAHIAYLYTLTTRADQKVGRDAIERYRVLRRELDARQAELARVAGSG
jgi:cell division septum initiation protein DivIVA